MLDITMEKEEPTANKIQVAAKIDAGLYTVIERFRVEEDRNLSNMIERLLKTHPRVQEILETADMRAA